MYQKHFGLADDPFTISPNPDYMLATGQHNEALAKCQYLISQKSGLAVVYGDVGTGKSTVARRLNSLLQNNPNIEARLLLSPAVKTDVALLRAIMQEFDVPTKRSHAANVQAFFKYAVEQYKQEKTVVVLVDEAQQMTPKMLELVRDLLNFESNKAKFMQIVLFGQNELDVMLRTREMRAIKSRVSTFAALSSLTSSDANKLISHRWQVAGGTEHPFQPDAVQTVFELSQGLPREIIKLCSESLLRAMHNGSNQVTAPMVREAAKSLRLVTED